jgi:MFS family permease
MRPRSPRFAVYALVFLTDSVNMALVPLLPRFVDRFDLGGLATGALVAASGVAMAVVSVPSGRLTERFGPRRVTVAAAVGVVLTSLMTPFAPSFAVLLLARLVAGVAMAFAWVAGAAWIARTVAPDKSARALGVIVTAAGAGTAFGPVVAGLTGDQLGVAAPFLIHAACVIPIGIALAAAEADESLSPAPQAEADGGAAEALGSAGIVITLLALVVGGFLSSAVSVLIPLDLHAAGLSEGSIGLVFALGTLAMLGASGTTARAGPRLMGASVMVWGAVAQLAALAPAVVWGGVAAIVLMIFAAGVGRGVVGTASIPFASESARRDGVSIGTTMGLVNAAWAASTVVGPVAAGLVLEVASPRGAYAIVALTVLAMILPILYLRGPATAAPAVRPAPPPADPSPPSSSASAETSRLR